VSSLILSSKRLAFMRPLTRLLVRGGVLLLVANLAILAGTGVARAFSDMEAPPPPPDVHHFRQVDAKLLRGDAPSPATYRALAAMGVTTVVDLRAERHLPDDSALLAELGIERVNLPIRDGQVPAVADVERFIELVRDAPGLVYVHCNAGVGRTGSMLAAYRVRTGQASWGEALIDNLAVGPPSLQQLAFMAASGRPELRAPGKIVTAASITLDGPRRIWSRVRAALG
jgi:protein tyrosine phosphatase (PTP) superfamily phosphohydrolase (DUF442 family)